jgi:hypothetical protein
MTYTRARQAEFADPSPTSTLVYKAGDQVCLLRGNIQTTRPSSKLPFRGVSLFIVEKRISSHIYKLVLPPTMRIQPVFDVSLLEPTATDTFESQILPKPRPVIVNDREELLVEQILDAWTYYRKPRFLGKWTNSPNSAWELPERFRNPALKVRDFYHRYPNERFFSLPVPDPDSDPDEEPDSNAED